MLSEFKWETNSENPDVTYTRTLFENQNTVNRFSGVTTLGYFRDETFYHFVITISYKIAQTS